ncbi:hypothetical protein GF378_02010, partial [Candidatus Pacearchaeota archaeon]|nr:hypothetical protein [Candidatus Pacearchaeota archaeon]
MMVEKSVKALGSAAKNTAIGLGILILTSFVAIYGMNTFLDEPVYEDYCPGLGEVAVYEDAQACEDAGGKWRDYRKADFEKEISPTGGWCDVNYYCAQDYEAEREAYSKLLFLVSIPFGLIIIALGTFVFSLSSVGVGIMLGGVYTLIYGAAGYWRYGENWMRFTIS